MKKLKSLFTLLLFMPGANNLFSSLPLIQASIDGNIKKVKELISSGANPSYQDSNRFTPLVGAALRGSNNVAKLLIEKGANVNAQGENGSTPLFIAIERDNLELAEMLIKAGANVNVANYNGSTPLHEAIYSGNHDLDFLNLMLNNSIYDLDINKLNEDGYTPLMTAVNVDEVEVVKWFIRLGAMLDLQDNLFKETALMIAVERGFENIVFTLLKSGADINIKDSQNLTAIDKAMIAGNENIINMLTAAKALEQAISNKDADGFIDSLKVLKFYNINLGDRLKALKAIDLFKLMDMADESKDVKDSLPDNLKKVKYILNLAKSGELSRNILKKIVTEDSAINLELASIGNKEFYKYIITKLLNLYLLGNLPIGREYNGKKLKSDKKLPEELAAKIAIEF